MLAEHGGRVMLAGESESFSGQPTVLKAPRGDSRDRRSCRARSDAGRRGPHSCPGRPLPARRVAHQLHDLMLGARRGPLGNDGIEGRAVCPAVARRFSTRGSCSAPAVPALCTPRATSAAGSIDVNPVVGTAGRARVRRAGHRLSQLISGSRRHAGALVLAQAHADQVQDTDSCIETSTCWPRPVA